MTVEDYYRSVLVPANVAVSAIRRAGLPIDEKRALAAREALLGQAAVLEREVESFAAVRGIALRYSAAHQAPLEPLRTLLYSPKGLGLEKRKDTPTGLASTDDDGLAHYASIAMPRDGDVEMVWKILKIRSLARGAGTYLDAFLRTRRADGCCHPKFNWAVVRTPRISAEDPPVHQIPERADVLVADLIKSCIVPRVAPAPVPGVWNPHKHGACFRWDILGAEAAIRAAMLVHRFTSRRSLAAWEYVRLGKDVHGKTASLLYGVPEGTFKKGSRERDVEGKQTFFAKLFGGTWRAVQMTMWTRARTDLTRAQAEQFSDAIDRGYPELAELYEHDKIFLGKHGYSEDGYGRRRAISLPKGARYLGVANGVSRWADAPHLMGRQTRDELTDGESKGLAHCFHVAANTPTQGMNATDNLWMIALCYHGEYVDLRVPPMWEGRGLEFPEAATWQLHEGEGPGGKSLSAWHTNTVHDSGWGDAAPGHLEPAVKVIWRRCRALPMDWRLEADVPYRIELQVGPDMGHLRPYNEAAAEFGMEPLPEY